MFNLYNHIEDLARNRGYKNITELCKVAGVPRATMSEIKAGRSKDLSKPNAQKFADCLGMTLGEIYGTEQKKEAPSEEGDRDYIDSSNFTIHTEHPISILAAQYGVSSDVMADILETDRERAEKMILRLSQPEDQEIRRASEVFKVPAENIKAGIVPLNANSEVVREILKRTFDRYSRNLPHEK